MRGIGYFFYTDSYRDSGLGGSWVVISEVMSRKPLDVTDFQGLVIYSPTTTTATQLFSRRVLNDFKVRIRNSKP